MDKSENNRLAELLAELAQGNSLVLSEIDCRMQRILFSIGKPYFKDVEDLKDSIHDLYLLLKDKAKFFRENTSACAWIVVVYKNFIRSKLRKKKREKEYVECEIQNLKAQSIKVYEKDIENRLFFKEIMDKLTKREKDLLDYCRAELSVREISAIVHKPKSTVDNHLRKLKEKIKKM